MYVCRNFVNRQSTTFIKVQKLPHYNTAFRSGFMHFLFYFLIMLFDYVLSSHYPSTNSPE
jgi:hypothetical protein